MTIMERVVRMDTKRRPTLPSELLEAAGIAVGDELVASTDGHGAVILRSRTASLRQIRDEIISGFGLTESDHIVPSLREDRIDDDESLNRRLASASSDPNAAGAALLAQLCF